MEVAYKYARALVRVASEKDKLETVEGQLKALKELMEEAPEFQSMLVSPTMDKEKKKEIIGKALAGKVEEELLSFISLLIDKDRQDGLAGIVSLAIELAGRERNIVKAYVYTVERLDRDEKALLAEKLSKVLDKEVVIENHIDKDLLGGAVVKAGDLLFDGSIRGKLEGLRDMMNSALQNGIGVTGGNESEG
ncbi:MAG: F0F1 ATP synthase subunit delta [Bacillota bacterium]|nr:F0F1 ATP synthase subunit delta [Bacillota bacterium]